VPLPGPHQLGQLATLGLVLHGLEGQLGFAPVFDGLGQAHLVFGGEQVVGADPVEVLADRLVADFTFD
jgi:hypothetical protein